MDHMMPGMDGVEATMAIRALDDPSHDRDFKTLPIIALTANAMYGVREMFLENGFSDYLAKPVEMSKLNEIMEKWVPSAKREVIEPRTIGDTVSKGADSKGSAPTDAVPAIRKERPPAFTRRFSFRVAEENEIPKENVSAEASPLAGALPPAFMNIEGVDAARGVALTGGSPESYAEILDVFCEDASERLALLEEPPDETNLKSFTIHAHTLKSASATVGATEISKLAALLEAAGKNGDLPMIRENLDAFRVGLADLVARVRAARTEDS
jgi:CheY-like chemotaxis protein